MIYDLSHPIHDGMPIYPGDSETRIVRTAAHDREGYLVHALSMSSHAGTHCDAPCHYLPSGASVDSHTVLEACIGPAWVLDVSHVGLSAEILPIDLGIPPDSISPGDRILLATGWSAHSGKDDFFDRYPSVSEELAALFAERGIALLGVETPSLHLSKYNEVHLMLLKAGIIVVENLANLLPLAGKQVFFSAAPLKLLGLDGSPVRAYAID